MNHFDVRTEYSTQLGESLALSADGANLAEIAKLVNLPDTSDENIIGLGKPVKLTIPAIAGGIETDEGLKALGQGIMTQLVRARAGLARNHVPKDGRTVYVTPDAFSAILHVLMPNSANYHTIIDPETGSIKNIFGFEIVEAVQLTVGGADNTNAFDDVGNAFPTEGFVTPSNAVALIAHRSAVGQVKLRNMSLERARRPEYQADQIIAKYAMGHGGLRPEAVGAIVMDVTNVRTRKTVTK